MIPGVEIIIGILWVMEGDHPYHQVMQKVIKALIYHQDLKDHCNLYLLTLELEMRLQARQAKLKLVRIIKIRLTHIKKSGIRMDHRGPRLIYSQVSYSV